MMGVMKNKELALGILALLIIGIIFISGCIKQEVGKEEEQESETGFEWFQTGNIQTITQLQTKQSIELENNRIGSGIWDGFEEQSESDFTSTMSQSSIFDAGLDRVRVAINHLEPPVNWSMPEFSVHPSFDNFITNLADNGVTITYTLSFWDKAGHAIGEEVSYPRFKTENQIQRYLDFVQFIVHHFKDRVQIFEIWNEPDIEGSIQWIEVEDYINLVKRAVPVIRQEYPEAKIQVGGTTGLRMNSSQRYLFSILRSDNIMPLVDIVSWHPFFAESPEYQSQYYYEYPSIVENIKDVASAHGFEGEYEADELSWWTPEFQPPDMPGACSSDAICAKYYARGIVMHRGMNITVTVITGAITQPKGIPFTVAVQNLCTIMAGAEPINLPLEIQSQSTNIKYYTFSLSNGDNLIALWTDGVAVDNDPGVNANLTIQGITTQNVTGIDVLNGYQQSLTTSNENGNLVIQNLIVRDYPLILHIVK